MKPYYQDDHTTVYQGNVPDVLKEMAPESVQMCVTSPPYWGLRDYGLESQVWENNNDELGTARPEKWVGRDNLCDSGDSGGNAVLSDKPNLGCRHEWKHYFKPPTGGRNLPDNMPNTGGNHTQQIETNPSRDGTHSDFCQHCNAWRGSLGLEPTPELYIEHMVQVFRGVWRVLRKDGTVWLNLGDSYMGSGGPGSQYDNKATGAFKEGFHKYKNPNRKSTNGLKPKDLIGIPWRVALALQADGWYLRSDIIWSKPNPMPESVKDRPTKAHEYIFLLTKSGKYYYDAEAIKEDGAGNKWGKYSNPKYGDMEGIGGKMQSAKELTKDEYIEKYQKVNKRSVWTVPTQPFPEAHFAVFPEKLIEPCIKAGSRMGDTVLDPFGGSMTTAKVAKRLNRKSIMIELNQEYIEMGIKYLRQQGFQWQT